MPEVKEKKKWEEPDLSPLPSDELKKLASEIFQGRIYTSEFHDAQLAPFETFMSLMFGSIRDQYDVNDEQLKEYIGKFGMLYEHLDKAGPLAVNGNPMFLSCRIMPMANMKELRGYLIKLQEAKDKL